MMSGPDHRLLLSLVFLRFPRNKDSSNSPVGSVIVLVTGMDMDTRLSSSRSQIHGCIQRNKRTNRWITLLRITCTLQLTIFLDLLTITDNISTIPQHLAVLRLLLSLSRSNNTLFPPRLSQTLVLQASESNSTQHLRRARLISLHSLTPMGIRIRIIPDKGVMQAGWGCGMVSDSDPDYDSYLSFSPLLFFVRLLALLSYLHSQFSFFFFCDAMWISWWHLISPWHNKLLLILPRDTQKPNTWFIHPYDTFSYCTLSIVIIITTLHTYPTSFISSHSHFFSHSHPRRISFLSETPFSVATCEHLFFYWQRLIPNHTTIT